jgi:hypothetical protein
MLDLNINEIKRPNGAIGTQGVDIENIRSILTNVAKLSVPKDASMREMVDLFKQNVAAQNRIRSLMQEQPLEGVQLPDGSIYIKDGHHRAFLLNQAGDKTLPATIKDYSGPSKTHKTLGKAGIAAALAGGAGAASAGDLRRAAGDVAESFLPLGVTPSTLAPGTLTPEQRAASDAATQRKRTKEEAAKMKAQALLRTGVPMPDEYRRGGRVRMI